METEQSREGGEVRGLNPDNGEATRNAIILQKVIMVRSNTTPEPEAKTLQKETKARGRKIRGEVMVPNQTKETSLPMRLDQYKKKRTGLFKP